MSRMRTISNQEGNSASIRIVGLCTSLANAKDLGEWIGASSHGLYNFPPGKPVTLWCHVTWLTFMFMISWDICSF